MRTSAADVKLIIDTTLTDPVIEAYIDTANLFVTDTLGTSGLLETTLTNIEKWLSAHLIASTQERFTTEEGAGGAYAKYAGVFGVGLLGTPYGQMACMLDTSKTLSAMSNDIATVKKTASITAITSFE
jgi:hypothetical protein